MKHSKGDNLNGWLIIDKPEGINSTTIVNQTRHLLNAKKNGHTGTLDPFASGVLPIAFGEATKLISYVMDGDKEYEFTLQFGSTTDTLDPTGSVTSTCTRIPTQQEIIDIIPKFIGTVNQVPPIYSAIKINGKRAYDLARNKKHFIMPSRTIKIHRLDVIDFPSTTSARFFVSCSKGTYIRTLGADIAKSLDSLGYLSSLRRTKCANFNLSNTILLENLKNIEYIGERQKKLLPLLTSLCDITVIAVKEEDASKLKQGQRISPRSYNISNLIGEDVAATLNDELVALVRIEENRISPIRVFNL
ncbi:MAG: tRNA pseudouridine(55) synthase TruB [Alphaproteobacteria bacterium]|nr:tRNA pseudouridine(55) synthase TruB [Alphaproteobacteria bacterium]